MADLIGEQTPVWVVDVFRAPPLLGNPAAVILLDGDFPSAKAMQQAATALALPTLAIVVSNSSIPMIRWFTPRSELSLCGHASLAAGHVMLGEDSEATITFATMASGPLQCARENDGQVTVDLPSCRFSPTKVYERASAVLRAPVVAAAMASDFLYELPDQATVQEAQPDMKRLTEMPWRGHVITAAGDDKGVDFVSRTFFPALGVDEDQVCVSAHCMLAPYWAARLGKTSFNALQLSARGGRLSVRLEGGRVRVSANLVTRRLTTFGQERRLANAGLYRE